MKGISITIMYVTKRESVRITMKKITVKMLINKRREKISKR